MVEWVGRESGGPREKKPGGLCCVYGVPEFEAAGVGLGWAGVFVIIAQAVRDDDTRDFITRVYDIMGLDTAWACNCTLSTPHHSLHRHHRQCTQ
jgi:hypothetical protein